MLRLSVFIPYTNVQNGSQRVASTPFLLTFSSVLGHFGVIAATGTKYDSNSLPTCTSRLSVFKKVRDFDDKIVKVPFTLLCLLM